MITPLIIITGDKYRHLYFAQYLLNYFPEARLIIERQPPAAWGAHLDSPTTLAQEHFTAFRATEEIFFGALTTASEELLAQRTICQIETGAINHPEIIDILSGYKPCALATLSTSILGPAFIRTFPGIIVNYHAGLSPFYRGSGTNVFPICNREPEYIGATIHYIDEGIDSGDIIVQGRPEFSLDDDSHTLGCKTLIKGTELMRQAAELLLAGTPPKGHRQDLAKGRFYPLSAFTDDAIRSLHTAISDGIISNYAQQRPIHVDIQEDIVT